MSEYKRTTQDLQYLQGLSLDLKIKMTESRIREWIREYGEDGVYVSFSGGKDSLALLHLVRQIYPNMKAMHVNTGLEFPEIEKFVASFDNVDICKPTMPFVEVIKKYGYPIISKEVAECVCGARKYLTQVIQQNSISQTDRQTDRQTINGGRVDIKDYADWKSTQNLIGGGTRTSTKNSQESLLLQMLLTQDFGKTIDNLRVQRLMGINTIQGKNYPVMENIPSKDIPDKSMFSCERYQFMLDAPFEIGQQCCKVMKKNPAHQYAKKTGRVPITAQMASESRLRSQQWLRNGCNGFDLKNPISNPMSFWFDQDVLTYLRLNDIEPCSIYGKIVSDDELNGQMNLQDIFGTAVFDFGRPFYQTTGCNRSGCFACGFGLTRETSKEKSRYQTILDYSNPKICDWILRGGHFRESDGMWEPYQGCGFAFVIEWINIHGKFKIWYPNREYYLSQLPEECKEYLAP